MAKKGEKRKTPNVIGYKGIHPDLKSGWKKKTVIKMSGIDWAVYTRFREEDNPDCWVNVKVCAKERAPKKGNYNFGYSIVQKRVSNNHDIIAMMSNQPDMLSFLCRLFDCRCEVSLPAPRDERDDYWPDE